MILPDKLSKIGFINPSDNDILMFDLEVKKYVFEEVKNHRYNTSKNSVDRLYTMISYIEELDFYEKKFGS
jgi:hypothetical protein